MGVQVANPKSHQACRGNSEALFEAHEIPRSNPPNLDEGLHTEPIFELNRGRALLR
jgi:hypothetical protein